MKVLLTGACGFVGSTLAAAIAASGCGWEVVGFDNLGRPGSELNRRRLAQFGVKLLHGDLRCQSDVDALPGRVDSLTGLRVVALVGGTLLLLNCAVKSYLPRAVAVTVQREARDYERAFAPLSRLLKPGDQVWGEGMAWPACVLAGARLDICSGVVPIKGESHPDPARHRFVVIDGPAFAPRSGFRRIVQVDRPLPTALGRTLSNDHYRYEVWQSEQIP